MFGIKTVIGIIGLSTILNGAAGFAHKALLQKGIAEEVLRFHVLANSDSREDQEIKLKVRDAVLEWAEMVLEYEKLIEGGDTESDSGMTINKNTIISFLTNNLDKIKELAENVLQEYGYDYEITTKIQSCYFPDRTYRDCTFPAGWYDALRIEIGEAKGQNWWCVFYPKLCFADYLHVISDGDSTDVKKNETLEQILTVEEYELLLQNPGEWKIGFRWF